MKTATVLGLLLLASGAASAQTAATPPASDTLKAARAPAATDAVDRVCLRETGTLIRTRRAARAGERCPSHQFGRVYTQEDLRSTGQTDIAQALRMLDPSIH